MPCGKILERKGIAGVLHSDFKGTRWRTRAEIKGGQGASLCHEEKALIKKEARGGSTARDI